MLYFGPKSWSEAGEVSRPLCIWPSPDGWLRIRLLFHFRHETRKSCQIAPRLQWLYREFIGESNHHIGHVGIAIFDGEKLIWLAKPLSGLPLLFYGGHAFQSSISNRAYCKLPLNHSHYVGNWMLYPNISLQSQTSRDLHAKIPIQKIRPRISKENFLSKPTYWFY